MLGGIGGNCCGELISTKYSNQGGDVTFPEGVKKITVQHAALWWAVLIADTA